MTDSQLWPYRSLSRAMITATLEKNGAESHPLEGMSLHFVSTFSLNRN